MGEDGELEIKLARELNRVAGRKAAAVRDAPPRPDWLRGGWRPGRSMPPRLAARRSFMLRACLAAVAAAATAAGWFASLRYQGRRDWAEAEQRVRADVSAFANCRLRRIKEAAASPAAELVSDSGEVLGIVLLRPDKTLCVTLIGTKLRYRPSSDRSTRSMLSHAPPDDPRLLRFVKHGLGAALLLWPDLLPHSVTVDKVEAVSLTARKATVRLGIQRSNMRLGVAVEVDLENQRLVAVEIARL
ncbi:MAG: hypothetical protein H5T86_03310 [Armatimonadetes bacterium]|nr:hypothetical protein [Armatimonadota bacterium]